MADRSAAGRRAKRHGAEAEYEWAHMMRERGFTVVKVRNQPYDYIYWDRDAIYYPQIKSYVLCDSELNKAQQLLQNVVLPFGAIREVWMKNRRKGCRMKRGEPKKWIVEIGKEEA